MVLLLWDKIWKDIDVSHAVRLALFHDLPEALVWDIDAYAYEIKKYPERKIEKQKEERDAMGYLRDILSWEQGDEIFSYREEYEAWLTKEAKFVKALDKIETLHQFIDAGQKDFEDEASDFLATYADKCVSNYPELNDILSITKTKLKKTYKLWWLEWKDRYDIHWRN
jgi:5'-deoxynucleotidase YfbR-like HD superfamily hydrolase